jgi:hypothetical protein
MRGDPLDVDEPPGFTISENEVAQADERTLRRIGHVMEHRLPSEQPTDGQTVETTGELPIAPRLDGVRPSELMQAGIGRGDSWRDPAALA